MHFPPSEETDLPTNPQQPASSYERTKTPTSQLTYLLTHLFTFTYFRKVFYSHSSIQVHVTNGYMLNYEGADMYLFYGDRTLSNFVDVLLNLHRSQKFLNTYIVFLYIFLDFQTSI